VIIKELQVPYSKLLIIILSLSLANCNSDKGTKDTTCVPVQEPIDEKRLELDGQKGIVFFENNPFCGTAVLFKEATKIASIEYKQGRKHGTTNKWFADGQLSYEAHYKNGRQDSVSRTWWKNGNMRTQSNFSMGVPDGVQLSWYRGGQKFKQINLLKGKEEGIQKAWRANGKIYNNYEAKNGRIFGLKRANLCFELEDEKIQ
jgi:antitoxin component YwqK of YwqJK toxin-antitoxin module